VLSYSNHGYQKPFNRHKQTVATVKPQTRQSLSCLPKNHGYQNHTTNIINWIATIKAKMTQKMYLLAPNHGYTHKKRFSNVKVTSVAAPLNSEGYVKKGRWHSWYFAFLRYFVLIILSRFRVDSFEFLIICTNMPPVCPRTHSTVASVVRRDFLVP